MMVDSDEALLGAFAASSLGAVLSGRVDEAVVFGCVALAVSAFTIAEIDNLGVSEALDWLGSPDRRTDLVGTLKQWVPRVWVLDPEVEVLCLAVSLFLVAALLALFAQRTLERYSPFLHALLYCCAVGVAMRDQALEREQMQIALLATMVLLSLMSNHILRLHVAASLFCCFLVLLGQDMSDKKCFSLTNPFLVNLCLVVGFGTLIVHDLVVFLLLSAIWAALQSFYVVLFAFLGTDTLLELITGVSIDQAPFKLKSLLLQSPAARATAKTSASNSIIKPIYQLTWSECAGEWNAVLSDLLAQGFPSSGSSTFSRWLSSVISPSSLPTSFQRLRLLAPPFCAAISLALTVRLFVAPSAPWSKSESRRALVAVLFTLIAACAGAYFGGFHGHAAGDAKEILQFCTGPAFVSIASACMYAHLLGIVGPKIGSGAPKKWLTLGYWVNAFPDNAAGEESSTATVQGAPPPFVQKLEDDHRIRRSFQKYASEKLKFNLLSRELLKRENLVCLYARDGNAENKSPPASASKQRGTGSDNEAAANHGGQESKYLWFSDHKEAIAILELRGQLCDIAARLAALSEEIAAHTRDVASDAETEHAILQKAREYQHSKNGKESKPNVNTAIKRQVKNARATFAWHVMEMENAETTAAAELEQATMQIRETIIYYARLQVEFGQADVIGDRALAKTYLDRIRSTFNKIKASSSGQVMGNSQIDYLEQAHTRSILEELHSHSSKVNASSTSKRIRTHGSSSLSAKSKSQRGGREKTASLEKASSTPYEQAMMKKLGPDYREKNMDEVSETDVSRAESTDESQKRKKRRWWPFSSPMKSSKRDSPGKSRSGRKSSK